VISDYYCVLHQNRAARVVIPLGSRDPGISEVLIPNPGIENVGPGLQFLIITMINLWRVTNCVLLLLLLLLSLLLLLLSVSLQQVTTFTKLQKQQNTRSKTIGTVVDYSIYPLIPAYNILTDRPTSVTGSGRVAVRSRRCRFLYHLPSCYLVVRSVISSGHVAESTTSDAIVYDVNGATTPSWQSVGQSQRASS